MTQTTHTPGPWFQHRYYVSDKESFAIEDMNHANDNRQPMSPQTKELFQFIIEVTKLQFGVQ